MKMQLIRKAGLVFVCFVLSAQFLYAQFTSGRLAVLRVGRGLLSLTNASAPMYLDEFTKTGVPGFSMLIDTSGASALTCGGSAISEGLVNLSADLNTIVVTGYNTGTAVSNVANTGCAVVSRCVGLVNSSGVYSLLASTSGYFNTTNIRSAMYDGATLWVAGGSNGLLRGTNSISAVLSNTSTSIRHVAVYANQLFYSTGTGTKGIFRVGSGLPATGTVQSLSCFDTASGASPYQFAFNGDTTVCYIADDRASASGGVQKWVRSSNAWTLAYTFGTGVNNIGARGLTVDWSGSYPVIYATTAEASFNRIISITDSASIAPAVTLATATSNTLFRGICFTPGTSSLPVSWLSFSGLRTASGVELSWETASEVNADLFEIERSSDAIHFYRTGSVKAAGNSSVPLRYSFFDPVNESNEPVLYYRIRQTDYDGSYNYSIVIAVDTKHTHTSGFLYPNPAFDEIRIDPGSSTDTTGCEVDIYTDRGVCCLHLPDTGLPCRISTLTLEPGVYTVQVKSNSEVRSFRMIKSVIH